MNKKKIKLIKNTYGVFTHSYTHVLIKLKPLMSLISYV